MACWLAWLFQSWGDFFVLNKQKRVVASFVSSLHIVEDMNTCRVHWALSFTFTALSLELFWKLMVTLLKNTRWDFWAQTYVRQSAKQLWESKHARRYGEWWSTGAQTCAAADHHSPYRRWTNYSNPFRYLQPQSPPMSMLFVFPKHVHEWTK